MKLAAPAVVDEILVVLPHQPQSLQHRPLQWHLPLPQSLLQLVLELASAPQVGMIVKVPSSIVTFMVKVTTVLLMETAFPILERLPMRHAANVVVDPLEEEQEEVRHALTLQAGLTRQVAGATFMLLVQVSGV